MFNFAKSYNAAKHRAYSTSHRCIVVYDLLGIWLNAKAIPVAVNFDTTLCMPLSNFILMGRSNEVK